MITINITPAAVRELRYNALCQLSNYLKVVDPTKVDVVGTLTLDRLGNFVAANAFVVASPYWCPHRKIN